jgi:hypothetical protein
MKNSVHLECLYLEKETVHLRRPRALCTEVPTSRWFGEMPAISFTNGPSRRDEFSVDTLSISM